MSPFVAGFSLKFCLGVVATVTHNFFESGWFILVFFVCKAVVKDIIPVADEVTHVAVNQRHMLVHFVDYLYMVCVLVLIRNCA